MTEIEKEEKMKRVLYLKDDCDMTTKEVAEQLCISMPLVVKYYNDGKARGLHLKRHVEQMDDCPVEGCAGMVIAANGKEFRCTLKHHAFYEKGEVTFPEPPRPSSTKGYHRSSG